MRLVRGLAVADDADADRAINLLVLLVRTDVVGELVSTNGVWLPACWRSSAVWQPARGRRHIKIVRLRLHLRAFRLAPAPPTALALLARTCTGRAATGEVEEQKEPVDCLGERLG